MSSWETNKGKIIKNISNSYDVLINDKIITCTPRGKFKNLNITPLVGDNVLIDIDNKYIMDILPRENELIRPRVANCDIALIITSCKEPNLSLNLLDKEISLITLSDVEPVIIFTKLDLLNDNELDNIDKLKKYYSSIGYKVFYKEEIDNIKKYLKNKEVVLTGQSGAGKSTFLNMIGNLNIKTNEISYALGRGKHTTRHVEIYRIDDINFLDTPGFSSITLENYTKEEIRDSFIEFRDYLCKFKDCMHDKEIDCAVKDNPKILKSRYLNYLSFINEVNK